MKEGFLVGLMVGGFVGIVLHKYCKQVQDLADEGESMVKDEIKMIKKEANKVKKISIIQKIKLKMHKNNKKSRKNRDFFNFLTFFAKFCFY